MVYYFTMELCLGRVRESRGDRFCVFEKTYFCSEIRLRFAVISSILRAMSNMGVFVLKMNSSQISMEIINLGRYLQEGDMVPINMPLAVEKKKPVLKPKKQDKLGPIEEFSHSISAVELLHDTKQDLQMGWLAAYPNKEWILHELQRANAWILANPKKKPKKFGAFMTNWLSRAFESYRKGLPSFKKTFAQQREEETLARMREIGETLGMDLNLVNGDAWGTQKR